MTKQTGLGNLLYVGGFDLSGDIQSVGALGGGAAPLDYTAINQSAMDRLLGVRDCRIEVVTFVNAAVTGTAYDRYADLPTTDQTVTYCAGTAIGDPAANLVVKQLNYDMTRAQDGSLTVAVNAVGSGGTGLEWGNLLTAGTRTDTSATNGASYDFGAATAFGLQAFLHVTAFTGTDVTIRLQESSDDGAGDAFANVTDGAFAAVTSATPQAQRIQTSRTQAVERYLRVITATTGGFTSVSFAVVVVKNTTEVTFSG